MSKKRARPKSQPNGKAGKPRKRAPRARPLPMEGIEQVRNVKLDRLCEAIGEERDTKNAATVRERGHLAKVLEVMHDAKVTVYKHAGIELTRVPGAEKLRVRLVDDDGDAVVATGKETSTQADLGAS